VEGAAETAVLTAHKRRTNMGNENYFEMYGNDVTEILIDTGRGALWMQPHELTDRQLGILLEHYGASVSDDEFGNFAPMDPDDLVALHEEFTRRQAAQTAAPHTNPTNKE
jgi:hypothetical protein